MTNTERIIEEIKKLPEMEAREIVAEINHYLWWQSATIKVRGNGLVSAHDRLKRNLKNRS